jgi:hypothetical protein
VRIWRFRRWLGLAIVIALFGGLLWTTVRQVGREGPAAAARVGEAMRKATRQRVLTP